MNLMPLPKIKNSTNPKDKAGVRRIETDDFRSQLRQQNGQPVKKLVRLVKVQKEHPDLEVGDNLATLGDRIRVATAPQSEPEATGD